MAHRSDKLRRVVRPVQTETPTVQRQIPPTISQIVIQRAVHHPEMLTPSDVMALQRTIGNQAVQRLLSDEQGSFVGKVRAPSGGRPLPPDVQAKMEDSFGADFSSVRVHEGPQADAINARAYAQGNHIVFAQRQYDPHSRTGQTVLAHELAHVVQQRSGQVAGVTSGPTINANPVLESAADHAASSAVRGGPVQMSGAKSGIQRTPDKVVQRWPWSKKKKKNKAPKWQSHHAPKSDWGQNMGAGLFGSRAQGLSTDEQVDVIKNNKRSGMKKTLDYAGLW